MNVSDIIFSVVEKFSEAQDADSVVKCSQLNSQWNRVVNSYPGKFLNRQWMWVYRLTKNPQTMKNFQSSILDLLLRETQISPMVEDTWRLVRFLKSVGEPVTMSLCLDRSIPNNSKTGNGLTFDPDDARVITHVQRCVQQWLYRWAYSEDLRQNSFEWTEVEAETDKFFTMLVSYTEKDQWNDRYHNFDLYNEDNNANGSKITLYLNKLKIIYQLTEIIA